MRRFAAVVFCAAALIATALPALRATNAADCAAPSEPSAKVTSNDPWVQFAQAYCVKCHGPEKQEAKLRLDCLMLADTNNDNDPTGKRAISALQKGEMPPEESPRHPTGPEVLDIAAAFTDSVHLAEKAGRLKRERVPLKRLTRTQYRNTLRDLLKVEIGLNDPTRGLPDDRGGSDFDVVGDDLKMSDALMEVYLRAASQIIDEVTCDGPQPQSIHRQYIDTTDRYRLEGGIDGEIIGHEIYNHYDIDRGYWVTPQECGHVKIIGPTPFSVGGYYRLTFEVESLWRGRSDVTKALREYSPQRPHQFAVRLLSPEGTFPEVEYLVSIHELPDEKVVKIEHEVWVPKNWRLQLYFENGPACPMWVLYQELVGWHEIPTPANASASEREAIKKRNAEMLGGTYTTPQIKEFMRTVVSPRIRIHKMAIDGPLYKSWPPEFHTALYSSKDSREAIRNFSRRVFRRSATEEELQPFYSLAQKQGFHMAAKAMLCSPNFLYLYENEGKLDNEALANRLSYALTNSMPDDELFKLAAAGILTDPKVFNDQIERLLASSRSDDFIEGFVTQWLRLRNIDKMPPDEKRYPAFYRISHGYTGTKEAIVKEPVIYFRHLVTENLPVSLLIESDFTFMNDALADFYGVAGVNTSAFQTVKLDPSLKRGGLLGMAAVLTASANGVDTSPVVRGIYVLDNLMGKPPAPPPPGIKLPQPDVRGSTTIRDLLEKHSADTSCSSCHKTIDPIGFALENFDAVGHWRTAYTNRSINASGRFPNGTAFTDICGFKKELNAAGDMVAENLVRKLLVYFTGRNMGPLDDETIEQICATVKVNGGGMKDLVKTILNSEIFLQK
jgi:hypothetical protein